MKANYRRGGSVNTATAVASAAIATFNFVTRTLSTSKCAACVDDAVSILGMAMSPAAADNDLFEVAEAWEDVVYTIPFVDNATYQGAEAAAIVAAATSANKKYMGHIGFATFLNKYWALEVDTDGIHKIDISDAGNDALKLIDVEWDSTKSEWLAKVVVIDGASEVRGKEAAG